MPEIEIANTKIESGERKTVEVPVAKLFDYTQMSIPIQVICGQEEGPTLFISAAIHGDEIIGTEIVKRLLERKELKEIKGTLIAIPIVNPFGYNNNIRYLPDRRDLNRCFPGSANGSLAARIAYIFVKEILEKCTHGIDIHSGAVHRTNFPQIRLELNNKEEVKLARAFGAPVIIHSPQRPGTLRKAAQEKGLKMLLFEGGEALRFDDHSISICLYGILNVMREIGMLTKEEDSLPPHTTITAKSSHWIRAQNSGSLRIIKKLGDFVQADELLGVISDPFGQLKTEVRSLRPGIVIGAVTMPLVNRGNALFHIATLEDMNIVDVKHAADIVLDQDIDIENEDWFIRK